MKGYFLLFFILNYWTEASADMPDEPIQPLPQAIVLNKEKLALGERLFRDPRLSDNNRIACSTCHILNLSGADTRRYSIRANGQANAVNTLTVFNAVFNFKLHWTGVFDTLEDQIDEALQVNGNMTWDKLIPKLRHAPDYQAAFSSVYPDGIQIRNVKDAIATFERSLTTPNARFDKYLRGDSGAISPDEREGYLLFKSYGCIACHQGRNVGGNMFQKFGIMGDYFADRGYRTQADLGRFNVTKKTQDRHVFRVPSLRNVELTAPYLHDGSAKDLDAVVRVMAKYQLGRPMPDKDRGRIIAFLKTLTGEYQGKRLTHASASGPSTHARP